MKNKSNNASTVFQELPRILLLGALGFIMVFTTNFSIVLSYSLFLKKLGINYLPYFYIALNFCSIVIGTILVIKNFSGLKKLFTVTVLMSVLLLVIALYLDTENSGVIFTVYLMSGLFFVYSLMFYWNFINNTLTIQELKKYSGVIAGINFSGMILAGALMKPLLTMLPIRSCFLYSGVIYAFTAVILYFVAHKSEQPAEIPTSKGKLLIRDLFRSDLIKMMILCALVFGFVKYFVDFQTGNAIAAHFSDSRDIAAFYGVFNAISISIILAFQILATQRILKNISLSDIYRGAGIVIVIFSILCVIYPVFSLQVAFQFVMMFLAKVIIQPVVNLMVKANQSDSRPRVRFLVDGMTYSLAVMITGFVIIIFTQLKVSIIIYPILAGVSGLIFLFTAQRLNFAYLYSLLSNLRMGSEQPEQEKSEQYVSEDISLLMEPQSLNDPSFQPISDSNPATIRELLKKEGEPELRNTIKKILEASEEPAVISTVIDAMGSRGSKDSIEIIHPFIRHKDPEVQSSAILAVIKISDNPDHLETAVNQLISMLKADEPLSRMYAVILLGELGLDCFVPAVDRILKDPSPDVRKRAIEASLKLRAHSLIHTLAAMLKNEDNRDLFPLIENTIGKLKDEVYDELLHLARGLDFSARQKVINCLRKGSDEMPLDLVLKCLNTLPQQVSIKMIEFLSQSPPDKDAQEILSTCFTENSCNLVPLVKKSVLPDNTSEYPFRILQELSAAGAGEIIEESLVSFLESRFLETPGREEASVCFKLAEISKPGIEEAMLVFENITSDDPVKADLAMEILESSKGGRLGKSLLRIIGNIRRDKE